jgi:hypothetical protein
MGQKTKKEIKLIFGTRHEGRIAGVNMNEVVYVVYGNLRMDDMPQNWNHRENKMAATKLIG